MEDRQTYTYKQRNEQKIDPVKLALLIVAVVVIVAAAVVGTRLGTKKAERESSALASQAAVSKAAEASTVPAAKYSPGSYTVQTGGYTLLLREKPSKEAPDRGEIPDKTSIRITEISEKTETSDKNYQYWGKTQYEGEVGWVPMGYLVYDAEQPDPEETTVEQTTEADEEGEEPEDEAQED